MYRIALLALLLPALVSAQTKPSAPPVADTDSFKNESIVFERLETTIRMHADGTGERDTHTEIRIQSEAAARQFGVLSFAYDSANETPTIAYVRVHKADGSTVETPSADAIEMPAPVTRQAPLYSDLKEKQIPVRSLTAGDTIEYQLNTAITKAETPGQFWGADHFTPPGTFIVLKETLTLEVPKDKYVEVWSPNHKPVTSDHDGLRTYTWTVAQRTPAPKEGDSSTPKSVAPKDPDEDADGRKLPSVAWTTFHNWAEVGDWYRALALPRAQPTDALKARADEITKDAKTPEDQVRAIYQFVSTGTRYIGIDLGAGRYQPHPAADVLANQYGDCKDQDTLLEALLRAKGFTTAPALIGVGITPVADVPSPAVFNHVITTVTIPGQQGHIWLDSTPEVAPYRLLIAAIRDQQALVIPADAPAALERTPATAPYPFVSRFEAKGTLDAEGKMSGHIDASYRTDDEVIVRDLARAAPADWDKASQYVSSNTGFSGTTSNTRFAHANDYGAPIELMYDYTRHPFGDWDNLRIVPLFPALDFNLLDTDDPAPTTDIELGAPRTLVATSRIKLPEGFHTDLPDPIHVKTPFATFDKTYKFQNGEIIADRTIVVLKQKVPKADWKSYQAFTKDISLGSENWIQLIRPIKPVEAKAIAPPVVKEDKKTGTRTTTVQLSAPTNPNEKIAEPPADASLQELMQTAGQQMMAMQWANATATLDRIKAKDPKHEGLWLMYGAVAESQQHYPEALDDFRKELSQFPDSARAAGALADTQKRSGDAAGARKTLEDFLAKHNAVDVGGGLRLDLMLAAYQNEAGDHEAALKTLTTAADKDPDSRSIRLQEANTLLLLKRNDEAAAAAKSVLDGNDGTADTLYGNDAAYVLSQTGLDLPFAEEVSRRGIAKLEESSATISTAEVNSKAFGQANLLIAAWDTLGWILYREGKLDDAEPYLLAAWRNGLHPEVGAHLAELYEAKGKKQEALNMYALARGSKEGGATEEVRSSIKEGIARLVAGGLNPPAVDTVQVLQASRTYKIARPSGTSGWGTFRLQITAAGVAGTQQISGEQKLAGLSTAIAALKFPELVPKESKAHLLRSGVVSCSGDTCDLVLVPNSSMRTEITQ
jgi:transglutaminase-like putative cysteine protease/tetratricopeptide (TPR) repeat protein